MEKARENFKDQNIDLKQEIKHLKYQLKEVSIESVIELIQNNENIENLKVDAKEKQKTMVLGDIKNLIKDYKNERKLNGKTC